MRGPKLTTQINIVFTVVTLLTSIIFIVVLNLVFTRYRETQNDQQLASYLEFVKKNLNKREYMGSNEHNGYIIEINGVVWTYNIGNSGDLDVLKGNYTVSQLITRFHSNFSPKAAKDTIAGETYQFKIERLENGLIIVFTGETYMKQVGVAINQITQVSFISMVVLGNMIILLWSRLTVDRIKRLKGEVENLSSNQYQVPINIEGTDEITELARTIDIMRREIEISERTKQEIMQNISHDFKTPIAVIQSYAEAIADGISDASEAKVIIKQAEALNIKVKQLLELNKLEYLKDQSNFVDVRIRDIIQNIVDNQKYRTNILFIVDCDDSTYFGLAENFYTAFSNIIENALRYAKSRIEITLKTKKLTFFNDGEPISQKFIDEMFKPYEKGHKGEFGLGMSIVQRTVTHFNLSLKVENIKDGVMFTIEPF